MQVHINMKYDNFDDDEFIDYFRFTSQNVI